MKYLFKLLAALALAMAGSQALALSIMPDDCGDGLDGSIQCWTGSETTANEINKVVSMMFPVTELYRADVLSGEDKLLAGSYATEFLGTDALITFTVGQQSINCPTCYLLVKDADSTPAWYLFNISEMWDGMGTITLEKFWSGSSGAISQVSIFGGPPGTSVLAPGPLGIMSIGLLMLSVMRRLKES